MRRLYTYYIYMLLAALGLPGCELIHDDDMDCQLYTPEGVPYAYVSIALSTAMTPSTRAADDPSGGEEGDGREPGQSYENEVNDITLFFYDEEDAPDGVNSAAATPIPVIRQYFSKDNINSEGQTSASTKTVPVERLLVSHNYHVLAVVNGGEGFGTNIQTLGDLQRETVKELYKVSETGGGTTYTNFLMASADDESAPLYVRPTNSETNPATTQIDVERVTARVDYRAAASYEVGTEGSEPIGTAKITGAMLVNTLNSTATSYLLKRVTTEGAGFTSDIIYLGDETPTPSGSATNYVIDPLSRGKSDNDMSTNYDNYFNNISYDNAAEWESDFIEGTPIRDSQNVEWKRVGYPKENTAEKGSRYYSTGIVFKAEVTLENKTNPKTLFEYNGKVYTDLETIMREFEGDNIWSLITGVWTVNSWDDLQSNIIARLLDNDPTGYKAFLQSKVAENGEFNKPDLRWPAYAKTYLYYTNNNGTVSIDEGTDVADGATRRALSEVNKTADGKLPDLRVRTYKDGIAYYTYWIKHSNDGDNTNDGAGGGIMEYGIVRNNIYQLNVTGISRLGDDVPGDRTLEINVTVRNWEQMDEETVDMVETETN